MLRNSCSCSRSNEPPGGRAIASAIRPRVAWVAVEPTPYHMPLFDRIRRDGRIEIEYFFCARQIDQQWEMGAYAELIAPASDARRYSFRGLYFNPAILKALLARRWDVVVFSGYAHWTMQAGILSCLARGIPFVLQSDTHLLRRRHWLKRGVKRSLLFPILRRASAGIGLGLLQRRYLESMGIPASRLFTVPLTPHLDRFQLEAAERQRLRAAWRCQWGIAESDVVGIFVGRLVPVKGLDVLLDAIGMLPAGSRPHLVLIGDGPEREKLGRLAAARALSVHFAGFCQNEKLPERMAAADFFVLPSLEEGWGVVVAEAMAAGLPLVLSDQVGAAYDLLEPERNGFLVPAGSAEALRAALARCVGQRGRLAEMGCRSREIIRGWNCEASAEAFFQAIAAALPGGLAR